MAVDTAQKRASSLGFGVPFILNLMPDGSIDQGDRQTSANSYRGILAGIVITKTIGNVTAAFTDSGISTQFKPDEITTNFKPNTITVTFN